MKNIDTWLRKEAEELAIRADKIEKKMIQETNKGNFDNINELNIQKRELKAQEFIKGLEGSVGLRRELNKVKSFEEIEDLMRGLL